MKRERSIKIITFICKHSVANRDLRLIGNPKGMAGNRLGPRIGEAGTLIAFARRLYREKMTDDQIPFSVAFLLLPAFPSNFRGMIPKATAVEIIPITIHDPSKPRIPCTKA